MGLGLYVTYKNGKNKLIYLGEIIERKVRKIYEFKKVKNSKRKCLYTELTKEQKEAIDKFYLENYGEKIPYNWHQLYTSFTGNFDEKYFPEFLYIPLLERLWNSSRYKYALEDKNLLPLITSNQTGIRTPEILVSCINGILRDTKFNFINITEAEKIIKTNEKVFIKPSIDSGSGVGCKILASNNMVIKDLINKYNGNFCIQEIIECEESLKKLYPYGVNTFRVISYIWENEIKVCPIVLRIGKSKNYLDNAHAGGIFVGVKESGRLISCAFNEFQQRFYKHPDTNIVFENYEIPKVSELIENIKILHRRIPYLNIIHWDATIDENKKVVIIEANTYDGSIWIAQMAHGKSVFGDDTAGILQMLRKHKKYF